MMQVAGAVPALAGEAAKRAEAALMRRSAGQEFDVAEARQMFNALVGSPAAQAMAKS
jgi:hypothetical protein